MRACASICGNKLFLKPSSPAISSYCLSMVPPVAIMRRVIFSLLRVAKSYGNNATLPKRVMGYQRIYEALDKKRPALLTIL